MLDQLSGMSMPLTGITPDHHGSTSSMSHSHSQILRGELLLMLAVALLAGAKNPANVELMPEAVRCTGLALAFNIAEGYCGGTTPLIASWLISSSGNCLQLLQCPRLLAQGVKYRLLVRK